MGALDVDAAFFDGTGVLEVDGGAAAHEGEDVAEFGGYGAEGAGEDQRGTVGGEEEIAHVAVGREIYYLVFYDAQQGPAILDEARLGCGADGSCLLHHTTGIFRLCGLHSSSWFCQKIMW